MDLLRAQLAGVSYGSSGALYWRRRAVDVMPQQGLFVMPSDLNWTDTPGSWVQYRDRMYVAGAATDNASVDEHLRVYRLGLQAPSKTPTLAGVAGPGTTGSCRVALAFYDLTVDEWSPLSDFSNELDLNNQGRFIDNVQTSSNDRRASHIGVWVSMDGGAPRLSVMRQIGVPNITESTATLALGQAFPTTFTRMPRCTGFQVYHDRLIGFGSYLDPDRVFVSAIGRPERYEGLSFRTRNGEAVTAIIALRDVCLVMTANNAYTLHGYKDSDMSLTPLEAGEGCINHHCWRILPGGNAVGANHNRVWLYNGAFHSLSNDRASAWADLYKANREQMEQSHGVIDPVNGTYSLMVHSRAGALSVPAEIPNPYNDTIGTIAWTFPYASVVPEIAGGMSAPTWLVDAYSRPIVSSGLLSVPGTKRFDVYMGFCDGLVRGLDDTDADDDGDDFAKLWWIRTGANSFGDPGGFEGDGKTWTMLWSYLESEAAAWGVYFKGGDEDAWRMLTPDNISYFWGDSFAASLLVVSANHLTTTYAAKSVHPHVPQMVTGRCLTAEYYSLSPVGIRFRGFGGVYGPGAATRPVVNTALDK